MKKVYCLVALEDVLQRDEACNAEDMLEDYEEWDSLSKMAIMSYFDKNFGIKITLNQLKEIHQVNDLIQMAGSKIDD